MSILLSALEQALVWYEQPLFRLIEDAHAVHEHHHASEEIQKCTLLSIKTGGCPEDCAYCPQSAHYETGLKRQALVPVAEVHRAVCEAKIQGSQRFCLGASGRQVVDGFEFDQILEMVRCIKAEGMEACVTLGMLTLPQAQRLKEAGLDAYNHNIDTSRDYYSHIITTRTYEDRLETLRVAREAGLQLCSGGILGMGESIRDRCAWIGELSQLDPQPESVPINLLIPVPGTPLETAQPIDSVELIRFIAVARLLMPRTRLRLSAGRTALNLEAQILAFYVGINSIFLGEKLLTRPNPAVEQDQAFLAKLL